MIEHNYNVNTKHSIVILSSCDTGISQIQNAPKQRAKPKGYDTTRLLNKWLRILVYTPTSNPRDLHLCSIYAQAIEIERNTHCD